MSVPSTSGPASTPYDISTVDLDDDRYEVTQSAIRNKYVVRDSTGNVVLRGKQKMFKMKEEFPFVNGNDEDAFTVKAGGTMDVAGNYAITDAGTGEEVVVLDEDFSLFVENWTIRDPDTGESLATIRSKSKPLAALRHLVSFANLIPNKYEIFNADDETDNERTSGGHRPDCVPQGFRCYRSGVSVDLRRLLQILTHPGTQGCRG
ncbi:hypothetical protein NDI54_13125 [Haloarcula sp. S1AR25-5A]|uniref:Uncharacterized protein n=1 Tax=Haloarcula terrestris TaxID=2950533 RepID=A0AAE4JJS5_9EURY|nr:hypothetical protein [Haloarcula terrestris]MDS0222291.1 hypothetical protein [Haloarcula terrestris]